MEGVQGGIVEGERRDSERARRNEGIGLNMRTGKCRWKIEKKYCGVYDGRWMWNVRSLDIVIIN